MLGILGIKNTVVDKTIPASIVLKPTYPVNTNEMIHDKSELNIA